MKIEALHVGMRVRHPQWGMGTVKSVTEHTAEIKHDDGILRSVDPVLCGLLPAEPQAALSGLDLPLRQFVDQTIESVLVRLGWEKPEAVVHELASRWQRGRLVLHPSDPTLATKELPLETFFHKLVGMRNQLRVLEQKINGHPQMSDADKLEMQQYISRCHGSMTTFNLLFKSKEDQFSSKTGE